MCMHEVYSKQLALNFRDTLTLAKFDQSRAGHTNQCRGLQCEHRPQHLDTYQPATEFVIVSVSESESLRTESALV